MKLILVAFSILFWHSIALGAGSAPLPNVILIIGDDISPDFSAYGGPVQTPNIDELAAGGVLFDNAYTTASSCSPSRNSMLTGRYPHNHGAPELHMPLPEGQFMFSSVLKEQGYYSLALGKWHMGDVPKKTFDKVIDRGYLEDYTGAADWVSEFRSRPRGRPFFLWLGAYDAHRPWEPDPENPHHGKDVQLVAGVPDTELARQDLAYYYDEVRRFDAKIGELIDEVRDQGELDNTLIIIVGDNGRPFPRNKTTLYENGMKVPLVMYWPAGKFVAGARSSSLVSVIDIAPTILDALDLEVPEEVQGLSMLPIAQSPGYQSREVLFGERNWHTQIGIGRMVRYQQYAYMRDFTPSSYHFLMVNNKKASYSELLRLRDEDQLDLAEAELFSASRKAEQLFDVEQDPQQLNDLSGDPKYEKTLTFLRDKLSEWQSETGDSIPEPDDLTPDRHDRETYERLYPGLRPPDGIVPGEQAGATDINKRGPLR